MMTMKQLESKLQKADKKQAYLYLFCNFISLMLITAYSAMMFSPTVLLVLPEGGDSRKQMTAIFVLALFGCVVFTIYASSLFFRKKAKQLGTLMALGASRKRLAPGLFREVLILSGSSSLLGILAGFPFVLLLWNGFRLFIVNSAEMVLKLDFKCLFLSAVFFVLVVAFSCFTAYRYLKRTNIMDVIHEEHKNEPVRESGRFGGPIGILLVLAGAVCGYIAPGIYMRLFSAYPSPLINLFYVPVFIGLYMIMLHTVVRGWRSHKKQPYRNIIARSMMKFQGKQTVNNLLVSTVLIAGACFAIFYIPMLSVGKIMETKSRSFDYVYHYRMDQSIPDKAQITSLASDYGTSLKDFREAPYLTLGMDGLAYIEDGNSYRYEYAPLVNSGKFLSSSAFEALTGQKQPVQKGTYLAISNDEETNTYLISEEASLLTNMTTRASVPVSFAGLVHYNLLVDSAGYYLLNDEDYNEISKGLTSDWKGMIHFFNADGEDSYEFGEAFFYTLVSSFGPECELPVYYDRVKKIAEEEAGNVYWGDTDSMTTISYDQPDSTDFRTYWAYMPKIRVLDAHDALRTFAVFLMMFLFISIVCILAALIISYTRCLTITINNRYVFDDLKRLGASPAFLRKEIKNQAGIVFKIPACVGMTAMFFLYTLLMYGNDGKLVPSELGGLAVCLLLLLFIILIDYFVYRYTVKSMARQLCIH